MKNFFHVEYSLPLTEKQLAHKRKKLLELLTYFKKIIRENKLWYSAAAGTLLGALREGDFIPWDDDLDLVIDLNTYNFLRQNYSQNLVSHDTNRNYPLLFPKFVWNTKDIFTNSVCLDLFIILPTTKKRIKKYRSLKNKVIFGIYASATTWEPFDLPTKILRLISLPLRKFFNIKGLFLKDVIKTLHEPQSNNYFIIDSPIINPQIIYHPNYQFDAIKTKFGPMTIDVTSRAQEILTTQYGPNWYVPRKTKNYFVHVNAVSVQKVKENKRKK